MNATLAREIEKLTNAQRIALIDDLWASVEDDPSNAALTPELDAVLEQRYHASLVQPAANLQRLEDIAQRYQIRL